MAPHRRREPRVHTRGRNKDGRRESRAARRGESQAGELRAARGRRSARDHRLPAHPAARADEGVGGADPRRAGCASRPGACRLRARRRRPRARSAAGRRRAHRADRRGLARPRRSVALRRDRDRQPGVRNRARAGRQQWTAARLRQERRSRHRAVPAVSVRRRRIRAVPADDRAPARSCDRRERAGHGARSKPLRLSLS